MKKLEEEFGVPLFHRANSKISLNETGKVAAEYAERALEANREMIDHVLAFERSLRTVYLGSCAPLPMNELVPILQERLPEKTISAEIVSDDRLIRGLKSRAYQLVILHEDVDDRSIYCQRYMEENLYLSIAEDHPLAQKDSVSFDELRNVRILVNSNIGFWQELCHSKIPAGNLLVQNSFDAFSELVQASNLPFFNSDQYIARGYTAPGRKSIPFRDPEAHATFWLACLANEQKQYRSVFNAVRGNLLRSR